MPCFHPLKGWRSKVPTKGGGLGVTFRAQDAYLDLPVEFACGQCVGCRLERARQWAVRLEHESRYHLHRWFVTLTYSDRQMPEHGTLVMRHFQLFMKRLRKARPGSKIRYFHCGEYGERTMRPHYHAILFGVDFPDRREIPSRDLQEFRSEELEALWGLGRTHLGTYSMQAAGYVARYILKKQTGDEGADFYRRVTPDGEVVNLLPPYVTMSRRPGIGAQFYEDWASDVFPSDVVVLNGREALPPKFYTGRLEKADPSAYEAVKRGRKARALRLKADSTLERLAVREEVCIARTRSLIRDLED